MAIDLELSIGETRKIAEAMVHLDHTDLTKTEYRVFWILRNRGIVKLKGSYIVMTEEFDNLSK